MNPENTTSERPNPHTITKEVPAKYLRLFAMDKDEKPVSLIRRAPIGLLGVLLGGGLLIAVILSASIIGGAFLDKYTSDNSLPASSGLYLTLFGVFISIVITISTALQAYVYTNSVIIVTTDKVVQVLYKTIISRTIVQFSLGEVTDVTVDQRGIIARAFDFGTITIETAGEQEECVMNFVPYPYGCSQAIMVAHEENIHTYGN